MSLPPDHQPQPGRAAVAVGAPRRRKAGWVVLALVLLAALLLLLSRCGNDDDTAASSATSSSATSSSATSASDAPSSSSAPATTSPSSSATTAPAPSASVPAGGAALAAASGTALLPLDAAVADGGLAASSGQDITATGITVESVPADEGFWVGDSASDRVWVQLEVNTESPFQVTAGQQVSFTGPLTPHDASFAETVGVTEEEGAAQLTAQAQHIEIDASTLTEQE